MTIILWSAVNILSTLSTHHWIFEIDLNFGFLAQVYFMKNLLTSHITGKQNMQSIIKNKDNKFCMAVKILQAL